MGITSKGQVTIPVEIRQRRGLLSNSEVDFEVEGNTVRIRRAHGRGRSTMDEIMALTRG